MTDEIHSEVIETDFTDEHGERLSERDLRELAAFADGSLDPKRSDELARRIERSPALAQLLDDQLRAVDAVRASAPTAPASLRSALASAAPPRLQRRTRLAVAPAGALVAAVAALAVALALVLPGGGGPSVAQAAAVADRGIVLPAPAQDKADRQMLASAVDGLHYPYWDDFGWRARGSRGDRLASHQMITVYYADHSNESIAYTIVGGSSLAVPGGAEHRVVQGTRFAIFRTGSRTVVTWLRHGHTCILSGVGVPASKMMRLAAWHGSSGALAAWSSDQA